ncbi:hypothetical protein DV737_g668, partial [Chaetothyriales sp. CBS 132003]
MPTLKNLSCQIRWADTDAPLQEYGTQYGDGVVETYVAVPDKSQRFYIRLTSNGFVHEGLAVVVFMDGTYQCNRNRVNLVPAKEGCPRERSEIDFIMRQKEKTIGEGLYMGRQWRFDDHNIVPDPPKMSEGDHFKFLGTIEVIILRCCARSVDDSGASDVSSAAESQILETAFRGRAESPVDRHNPISPVECPGTGKAVDMEDSPLGGLFGLFDGAADPPIPRSYFHEDVRDDYHYQTANDSEAQAWSNEIARGGAEEQMNDNDLQKPDAAGEILSGNQDSHQGSERNNVIATENASNSATDIGGGNDCPTHGPQFGSVDGTAQSGTNPTGIGSTARLSSVSRPLYGPHGTYFAMKSPATVDTPCDAEEEPRYDVPQSRVNKYGTTKQVQPGKGYLYAKKRYSPKYIDDPNDPYARFVFIYRTKEQLKKDIRLTLDAEPTGDEEIQQLENASKDELIQMVLRAQGALGGKIPSPSAPDVAGTSTRVGDFSEPVTFEPPGATHLDYRIPEQRPAFGMPSDSVGRGCSNDVAFASNTRGARSNPSGATPGDFKQQSWETNNAGNSETPVVQASNNTTNNQGTSWSNDYQIPAQNEDTTNNQGTSWSNDYQIPTQNEDINNQQTREAVENDRKSDIGQRGLQWQFAAYPRPQLPTYFGYGPHMRYYPAHPGHHYQQYPSSQRLSNSIKLINRSTEGPSKEHIASPNAE